MREGTVRCLVFFLVRFLPIDVLLTKVAETPTNLVGTRAHYGEIKSRNSLLFSCFQCAPGRSLSTAAECGECGRQTPHLRVRNGRPSGVLPSAASAGGRRRTCDYETIKPFASTQTITFKITSPEAHFFGRNAQDRNRECGRVRRVRLAVPSLEKFI